jgi:deazaflavin-dependent oxidoreductase (nitroreductase family)
MTEMTQDTARKLQRGFKYFNKFMLLMWRLGWGPWVNFWPEVVGRIMVITHTGRKSGLKRQTPVNYTIGDADKEHPADKKHPDDIYCMAGYGKASDWYRNLIAHPEVEVWLPDGWWAGVAEDVSDHEQRIYLIRQIAIASAFAARLAGINPHEMTDEELDKVTAEYRLIRIRRTAACTGPSGPGDLAWVWPLATMILLPLALRRRRK